MDADVGQGNDKLAASQTVISFRGTNAASPSEMLQDAWFGWSAGLGFSSASQVGMAIDFYEAVSGKSVYDGAAENTILTGHSLGAGLAGRRGAVGRSQPLNPF